jgi:hypothetical protein
MQWLYKIILGLLSFVILTLSSGAYSVETVTLLDRGEPYDSMVMQDGVLWVGKSRHQFNSYYVLEAYRTDGRLLDQKQLSHSLSTMKVGDDGAVVITGINPQQRLTEYSVARLQNGKIEAATKTIDLGGFITFWLGKIGGLQYFADIGGNPNDTDDPSYQLPAQTIFTSTGTNAKYLAARVRMPVAGTSFNGKIFIVSSDGIGQRGSSVVEVDPVSSAVRVISKSATARYRGIKHISHGQEILTLASAENKLQVISPKSGEVLREYTTSGFPRSFVTYGRCVIVGGDETNEVEAFDLSSEANERVFALKIDMSYEEFSGIKSIAVDHRSGNLFARSAYACNPIIEPCNHDYNRIVKFDDVAISELSKACRIDQ